LDVLSGVPQGTILGPLLFIIYINDLPEVCKNLCSIFLYADDAKLYKHVLQDKDHTDLQTAVDSIQEWMKKWLLKLNIACQPVLDITGFLTSSTFCIHVGFPIVWFQMCRHFLLNCCY